MNMENDATGVAEDVVDTATSDEDSSFYEEAATASEDGEIEETIVEEAEEVVEVEESSEAVSEEAETEEPEAETVEEVESTEVEEETPEEVVEEAAQLTPEELEEQTRLHNEQYIQNRANLETQLKETLYNLNEEDAELLAVEPEKVIPRIAAKLHVEVLEAATQGILAALPNVVRQVQKQGMVQEKAVDAFYSDWPELKAHHDEVEKIAAMYKQMNPTKTGAELAKGIGTMASVMLQKPLPGVSVAQEEAAPVVNTPPPAPAGRSTRSAPASAPADSGNDFTDMANALMDDY